MAGHVSSALRSLRSNPTFTAVAVASLALGLGLNTAVFSLVNAVLLQPLPVPHAEGLMSLYTLDPANPGFLSCSYPNYQDYRDRNTVFSGLMVFSTVPVTLTETTPPEEFAGQIVSGNYFDVLGVKPVSGRTFLPEEDTVPGAHAVVVISFGFWQRRFAGRPVIGKTVSLNKRAYTIVGVAARNFHGTNALINADLWIPMMMYQHIFPMADWLHQRKALLFAAVGRLKDGVGRDQAEAAMKTLAAQLAAAYPQENRGRTVALIPLNQALIHPNSRGAFLLGGESALAASALVLLIACVNVGNLLLVRTAGRRKEIALRLALGVSRRRLLAQWLTESMLLSAMGGAAALLLARWARDTLWNFRPPWMLGGNVTIGFDLHVAGFTLLLVLAAGVMFGLAPALAMTNPDLASELRERRSPWTNPGGRASLRGILVMSQVAMSVVALSGAALFVRSLRYAEAIQPGFDAQRVASMSLDVKARGFSEASGREYYRQVIEHVSRLPGVEAATLSSNAPFTARARTFFIEGREAAAGPGTVALIDIVEPGYFQAVRTPLVRGRGFSDEDGPTAPRVAMVNETMARRYWNGRDPIGARLRFAGDSSPVEIVGLAANRAYISLSEPPRPMIYLSLRQTYLPEVSLYVRSPGEPRGMIEAAWREVQSLDPGVVISNLQTMPEVIHESLWAPRLGAVLFATFGALAGLLTVVGIYGVISYSVGQRTREMGIRMALGAQAANVLRQVIGEGVVLVAWGLLLGLAVMLTISRVLSGLLLGVSARDPLTLAAVAGVLLLTALIACAVPALRATRIDPLAALRYEG